MSEVPHYHLCTPKLFTKCDGCTEIHELNSQITDIELLLDYLTSRRAILTRQFDQVGLTVERALKMYSPERVFTGSEDEVEIPEEDNEDTLF